MLVEIQHNPNRFSRSQSIIWAITCVSGEGAGLTSPVNGCATYCGVIGRDIEQNFRGASAGYVSVAVPHTRDQVGLTSHGKRRNTN